MMLGASLGEAAFCCACDDRLHTIKNKAMHTLLMNSRLRMMQLRLRSGGSAEKPAKALRWDRARSIANVLGVENLGIRLFLKRVGG